MRIAAQGDTTTRLENPVTSEPLLHHLLYDEGVETFNSDVELARALMSGSLEAFDRFVDRYHGKLFQYSYTVCGQREDAEEVAQETLMRVFESMDQLREPERLKAWVFRIAKNFCLMKRRKSVFAPEHELSLDELRPDIHGEGDRRLELADWSALPEELAANAEIQGLLRSAIGSLPELYRQVFLLREIEGLSTEETAEILEVSTDVVKTRLHRARLGLRKSLDESLRGAEHGAR